MADSEHLYAKTHLSGEINSSDVLKAKKSVGQVMSFTHFLGKFLFFALFLIAIPLFPSQAPDFVNQTVLNKFWELVHLLFIGIAVSYGLFCRKNDDLDVETQSNNTDDSQSYGSRVLLSSIFDDVLGNSYGYNEKNGDQTWHSENGSSVIGDQSKARSLNSENGFENPSGYGENYVNQAWNYSQYVQGESMVVVNQESCAVNEYGESKLMMSRKSLGLPVRSLRSRVRNEDDTEISDGSESSPVSRGSPNSPKKESINNTFGEMGPLNLENKFNESGSAALSSPNPWRSISGRMEMRENVGIASRPSHFRPLSVDETQFESLKSQSFWSTENLSSQISSMSDSLSRLSPSHVVSSELENLKVEELGKEKINRNSYPPATPRTNVKASLNAFHIRRYTNGSLFEKNVRKSFEDDLKNRDESKRKDQLSDQEGRSGSLKWNGSSANASSRGKSVRTFRSRRYEAEAVKTGEKLGNHINSNVGKPSDEIEAVYKGKSEMENEGLDNLSATSRKQYHDNHFPMPKPAHSEFQKRKNGEHSENVAVESKGKSRSKAEIFGVKSDEKSMTVAVESKGKSRSKAEIFGVKSDEKSMTDSGNDAETDPNEVDKKAGEFIARFREQIRLQKMASKGKSRGQNHHHFR